MKLVKNKLRVSHFPQIPCKAFEVQVKDEHEAKKILDVLANQHLFLLDQKIIHDYSNIIIVEMFEEDCDGEENPGWNDYYNDEENMFWEEFEEKYLSQKTEKAKNN